MMTMMGGGPSRFTNPGMECSAKTLSLFLSSDNSKLKAGRDSIRTLNLNEILFVFYTCLPVTHRFCDV